MCVGLVMSPQHGGVDGRGMRALSQILSDESLSYSLKHLYAGTLTSHFMEEHSSPTSIFPVFMMTSSKGNMFRVTGFCAGNSPVTAGNSPATGEFPSHRPVTRSFDVFFDLCLNKRLSIQPRRWWFETPSRSLWRYCNVTIWDLSAFNASLLSNFELGGSANYGWNGFKFGTLLYPDYHSLKLTIFCTQRQFKFVVSDHP